MLFKELLIIIAIFGFAAAAVPPYIKVCGAKNPHLDDCVTDSIAALTGKLRNGIPELDVPSSDPVLIDQMMVADMPNFQATASDLQLKGLSNYHINHLHVNLKSHEIDFEVMFPKCELNARYNITARILVPIVGSGPVYLSANDVIAKVHMMFKLVEHNGKQYLYFPSMTTRLDIKDYTFDFKAENFDETLQDAMKQAFGSSRQEMLDTIKPNIEKSISQMCLTVANKICKHFTYDELFPDRE